MEDTSKYKWTHWFPNPFGIDFLASAECGAGGSCQFLALSRSLKYTLGEDANDLRRRVVREWQNSSSEEQTDLYGRWAAEKALSTFPKRLQWVESEADLGKALSKPLESGNGWDYEGDGLSLLLLSRSLGCIIGLFDEYGRCYTVIGDESKASYGMLIRLIDKGSFKHFQAVGLTTSDGEVITCLPLSVLRRLKPNLARTFSL